MKYKIGQEIEITEDFTLKTVGGRELTVKAGDKAIIDSRSRIKYISGQARDVMQMLGKDIEVNGTENLLKILGNDTRIVTIFLKVGKEELKRRLIERGDNIQDIEVRLGRLEYEEDKIKLYDYVIKNDDFEKTVQVIMTIIENEKRIEDERV